MKGEHEVEMWLCPLSEWLEEQNLMDYASPSSILPQSTPMKLLEE